MQKVIILVSMLLVVALSPLPANAAELFKVLYTKRTNIATNHVIWVSKKAQEKHNLLGVAGDQCTKRFCLIWFFNDKRKAKVGAEIADATKFWPERDVPGRIGFFVRNKMSNGLVCYDLSGNCK